MAFEGSLIYLGDSNVPFPNDFIFKETYSIAPEQRQDVNSGLNGNFVMLRNVAAHTRTKIEWNTIPEITNNDLIQLCKLFSDNYISSIERKIKVRYYNPETDDYNIGEFYKPDVTYAIKRLDEKKKVVVYAAVKFSLIEY